MRRSSLMLVVMAAGIFALLGRGGEEPALPAHADSPPPGSGWVLVGYQNYYYTYYITEQVGTTTVTRYLYSEPYRDRVEYFQQTMLSSITWYSQLTSNQTKLLTYRSYCWLNPYYPWDMQCHWVSEWRTDQYYQPAYRFSYTTVYVPYVVTDYRPVYGSVRVPVYQQVRRTGVCSVPVYQFVGGDGAVTLNSDGTFTMWVPQSSCVYSPYTNSYLEATPQVVYNGRACRQQLNATLSQYTSYVRVYILTSVTYSVATSQRYQCQTIYWPTWVYQYSYDCSYEVSCNPWTNSFSRTSEWYSSDGLTKYVRTEYHPGCPDCWVYCTTYVYRKVDQPVTDCRWMPYDFIQQHMTGNYYQNAYYTYRESYWYTQQCWDTYTLTTTSAARSELVDRYVPNTSWQQMTFRMPAMPDVQIGVNPGAMGLTGLPSWFWADNVGISETEGPYGVRARLVPVRYDWDFNGDGRVDLSTTSPGRPYPMPSDVRYTYERSSASQPGRAYQVRLTVVYELQVNAGQGYRTVGTLVQERSRPYPVQQLQSSLGG